MIYGCGCCGKAACDDEDCPGCVLVRWENGEVVEDVTTLDTYEAALYQGPWRMADWVSGSPCEFGRVEPGPTSYMVRLPDGRHWRAELPIRPTGGLFTIEGPLRIRRNAEVGRYDLQPWYSPPTGAWRELIAGT